MKTIQTYESKTVSITVSYDTRKRLLKTAAREGVSAAQLIRRYLTNAPPVHRLPPAWGPFLVVAATFLRPEALCDLDDERGDMPRSEYLRRVIEWGLA